MTQVFSDQEKFMSACDQTVNKYNPEQYAMYIKLIREEFKELMDAIDANDPIEQLDALLDIIVVTVGALHSGGFEGERAWKEVMRSNFDKIDPYSGRVRKREDGKVLKPDNWEPPKLEQYVTPRY
jgi:predicted HAD superfamily Cof-like phosphohydrolase